MTKRLSLLVAVLVALACVATAAPAQAGSAWRTDLRRDAPRTMDAKSVWYANGRSGFAAVIYVPRLERRGTARLQIAKWQTNRVYDVRAWIGKKKRVRTGVAYKVGHRSWPVKCHIRSVWNARKNYVSIYVPHACTRKIRKKNKIYMMAGMGSRGQDWVGEVRKLKKG